MKKIGLLMLLGGVCLFFMNHTSVFNNGALVLAASQKTSQKGKQVCMDVYAQNFDGIVSLQYSMKFDRKVMKFKEVTKLNLPGLQAANFGTNRLEKGILTFAWYDANVRGITVPDGHVLYQVCFDVVGDSGSKGYFNFTDYPTVQEVSNSKGQLIPMEGKAGAIKVRG